MLRSKWQRIALLIALVGLVGSLDVSSSWASENTLIAYVAPSRASQQIRVVAPDGKGDRLVWEMPGNAAREDRIGTIAWRPDGAEIAFDSGHDFMRSIQLRDLYGVQPNGAGLRRITGSPGPLNTAGRATGTVTLQVDNYAGGKDLSAYIDGGLDSYEFTAPDSSSWVITFTNVPDLGPDIRQYARVFSFTETPLGLTCWFDAASFADVQPGQIVHAGSLTSLRSVYCPFSFQPGWRADGATLAFLQQEITSRPDAPNNIWQINVDPAPTDYGERLLDMNQFVSVGRVYLLEYGPSAVSDQLIFARNDPLATPIFRGPASDLAAATEIDLGPCPNTRCDVLGLAWLPDGSGFLFSRLESGYYATDGVLYRYSFTSQLATELLRLPDEVIGRFALAPDGQTIAFERALRLDESLATVDFGPRVLCPCSIWTVGADGGGTRQIVADGRAPSWSRSAPVESPPLAPQAWLPQLRR